MNQIIRGIILGFIIVLPGMSGGTVFVIFGIYEQMVKDLVRFNFRPYYPLVLGMLIGIFAGGKAFASFFEAYRDITAAFLLGCLLASIKTVLKECPKLNLRGFLFSLVGLAVGFFLVGEPIGIMLTDQEVSWILLIIGGAFASAAMVLPGVPGSSVLIVMGIYDSMLFYLKELMMSKLIIFAIGSLLGILFLLKLLERIYKRYHDLISYFFAGLILGASRVLFPYQFNILVILIFLAGFSLVWFFSGRKEKRI
jgi:putative membrane protein